jgi:REP element-mobilizing transposase RayT
MLNHLQLIVTSSDMAGFLRDFKKLTSKQFKENLQANEPSVLILFVNDEGQYRFWMDDNTTKKVENDGFYLQKLNYIHENPVRKGYVACPEYWFWSSANPALPLPVRILTA